MTDADSPNRSDAPGRTKAGRLIDGCGFDGIGDELERRWTDDGGRDGLGTLTDAFNRRLLGRTMRDAGMDPLDGEAETVYCGDWKTQYDVATLLAEGGCRCGAEE